MKRIHLPDWIVLMVLAGAGGAAAMDVGLPGAMPGGGKMSLEVFYENFERDIHQEHLARRAAGEHSIMTRSSFVQEEKRFMARFGYALRPELAVHGLLGFAQSEGAENNAPVLGLGVDYRVWSGKWFDVGLFAAGQLVTEIKYDDEFFYGPNPPEPGDWEWPEGTQKEDYFELSAGAMVSKDFEIRPRFALRPYAGLQLSKLDGDEKYDHTWAIVEPLGREQLNGYIKDDGMVSLFAGVGAFLGDRFGLRLEGRFVNQTSFSAGLLYFF